MRPRVAKIVGKFAAFGSDRPALEEMEIAIVQSLPSRDVSTPRLVDSFLRPITYLRLSVTDRCDLRCVYCMSEKMEFLPRRDLLSIDELHRVCRAFIRKGVRKIRLTGGEPLVRRELGALLRLISRDLSDGSLAELTLTTNGMRLAEKAQELVDAGIRRVNVSVDTLDRASFRKTTRGGDLDRVLRGLDRARAVGLRVKINAVALKGVNEHEIPSMIRWAHDEGMDITLIETMPLGTVEEDRTDLYLPLDAVRDRLREFYSLTPLTERTGGPARYFRIAETGGQLGFITPMTHNFCESCNRVRVTCTGTMFSCLGQDDAVELREALRSGREALLDRAIDEGVRHKPRGHDFTIARKAAPAVARHMSVTGG
jgi:cyclic pyranopterin phosphate synthase